MDFEQLLSKGDTYQCLPNASQINLIDMFPIVITWKCSRIGFVICKLLVIQIIFIHHYISHL